MWEAYHYGCKYSRWQGKAACVPLSFFSRAISRARAVICHYVLPYLCFPVISSPAFVWRCHHSELLMRSLTAYASVGSSAIFQKMDFFIPLCPFICIICAPIALWESLIIEWLRLSWQYDKRLGMVWHSGVVGEGGGGEHKKCYAHLWQGCPLARLKRGTLLKDTKQ